MVSLSSPSYGVEKKQQQTGAMKEGGCREREQ
jgi:hypothetical protein